MLKSQVLLSDLPHPFGITLFEDSLYWTDWELKSVQTANKIDGSNQTTFAANLDALMDIHMFHRELPTGIGICPDVHYFFIKERKLLDFIIGNGKIYGKHTCSLDSILESITYFDLFNFIILKHPFSFCY